MGEQIFLTKNSPQEITPAMIKHYWTEMLQAVSVIHKAGIIHKVGSIHIVDQGECFCHLKTFYFL